MRVQLSEPEAGGVAGGVSEIAVIVALAAERAALAPLCSSAASASVHQSGPGLERALACARLATGGGAQGLVSFGLAGALDPGLATGAVLIPRRVRLDAGEILEADAAWVARLTRALGDALPLGDGDLLSSARLIASPAAKRQARLATGAIAVDMEAGAVARAAREARVPFVAVKVVFDAAHDALPPAAEQWVDAHGDPRWWPLLKAAVRPGGWSMQARLARRYRVARKTLEALARRLGPRAFCGPQAERESA